MNICFETHWIRLTTRWVLPVMVGLVVMHCQPSSLTGQVQSQRQVQDERALSERCLSLVRQLGNDDFETRELAHQELQRIGIPALDILLEYQNDDDIEVARRARRLVRTIEVSWATDDDPPAVRRIFANYRQKTRIDRRQVLNQLAQLSNGEGIEALCRLARYDSSLPFAKYAAYLVLTAEFNEPQEKKDIADRIERAVGQSRRPTADWLRTGVVMLREPERALDLWNELAMAEVQELALFPQQSSRDVVMGLLRRLAEKQLESEREGDADLTVNQVVLLVKDERAELLEMADWMLGLQRWQQLDLLYARHPQAFRQNPRLLYRVAEAQLRRGERDLAYETAELAAKMTSNGGVHLHSSMALSLQNDGLFEWAAFTYQKIIENPRAPVTIICRTRVYLAEMYHDLQRDDQAAETLDGVFEAVKDDESLQRQVEDDFNQQLDSFRARREYFWAMHFLRQQDSQRCAEHLLKAVELDPRDSDVLIAMHRQSPADDAWKKDVDNRITRAVQEYRNQIEELETDIQRTRSTSDRQVFERSLAIACNQLAWLVSNTKGDVDEAIRCSLRSLELIPDSAGFRDTLAHCFFAQGDYEKAVQWQTQALRLEPHSASMKKQLTLFTEALRKANSAE